MAGLLTALLYGAGGYGQGRQQAFQNKQTQQSLDQEQAYRQAEERRQDEQLKLQQQKAAADQDAATRDRGIDPATGKPFVLPPALMQLHPNNHGKGGQGTVQDQLNLLYSQANHMYQNGQLEQASALMSRAKALESDMRQATSNANTLSREKSMADYRTTLPMTPWQRYEEGLNDQYGPPGQRLSPYERWEEHFRELHPPGGSGSKGANKAATDEATFYTKWSKLTTAQNSQVPGVKNPPVIPPAQAAAASKKFSVIDKAGDPRAVAQALANKEPNAAIKALILERGNVAAEKKAGASSGDTGVSDDAENPTKGDKIPAHDIWQMVYESGATPEEATTLTSIAMAESGGDPTSVNRTDNHGKQTSWGLFQVSDGTHHEPQGWQDPETNIQMALAKLRSQGLQAWGTYNSGAYRKFMPASEQGE